MNGAGVNLSALEPLFAPHEEPNFHRVRAKDGQPAEAKRGRRPSPIAIAQNLRRFVKEWRETDYPGASDTTRELLHHWFARDHLIEISGGGRVPFRYYFCQREAIETLIYLYEVRGVRSLCGLMGEFAGPDAETAALGVNPEEDRWARYAFKLATGAGKTKVMSLAMVWSYFHALRESDSPLARHFVVVAPNLTVFERLREDFKPAQGGPDIFDRDPLIPVAWRGDWNLTTVLQDEAGGAATGGTLYLTNIHRLYDTSERRQREPEMHGFIGPAVSRAKALDTGAALRARVTSHARVLVLNDEAHHLWDPDSAWNEAIAFLHDEIARHSGDGVVAQLDFSATPKDNAGQIFQHVVCDTPLGEAVDGGIVKTPVIGRGKEWVEVKDPDASKRYQEQLMVGYARWRRSREEWSANKMKPVLFVMCEDTKAADEIAHTLNSDPIYAELNGRTLNLHTRLKVKINKKQSRQRGYTVFEPDEGEKGISDDDLKALRELSRQIDSDANPYTCIVSVLMLREGWDVRNVTTIVPLRPYTSKANILPEQTLGRGLRRMTPPGSAAELVTVVEHPAFVSLYRQELEQQGLFIETMDVDRVPTTTVTIFPDAEKKDIAALDIAIPAVSAGFSRRPTLEGLTLDDVRKQFAKYGALPVGEVRSERIEYTERHLITDEVVMKMEIRLPLLQSGVGAVSFFREELETVCGVRGTHALLAPLLETFLTELLFVEKLTLFDSRLVGRLSDADVREHVRAVFVPLIRQRTTLKEERRPEGAARSVAAWKAFQVTHSQEHPAIPAARTLFNLVACNRGLEVGMAQFLEHAPDVITFCKNAGPQALRVDYSTRQGQIALYTPDFLVRLADGSHLLVETKGRVDRDVPLKARAAAAWCKAAAKAKWRYLYVPQETFETFSGDRAELLARACEPALQDVLEEAAVPQMLLPFGEGRPGDERLGEFIADADFAALPPAHQKMVRQAVSLFRFLENKPGQSLAPVFTPLLGPLDEAAKAVLLARLGPDIPAEREAQRVFFDPDLSALSKKDAEMCKRRGNDLKRTLVDHNGMSPIGLLRWCLQFARESAVAPSPALAAVRQQFAAVDAEIYALVNRINTFRNDYIAHQNKELADAALTRSELAEWTGGLRKIWMLRC